MRTFSNRPGSWPEIRRKSLLSSGVLVVFVLGGLAFVDDGKVFTDPNPIFWVVFCGAMGVGLFLGNRRNRLGWESLQIVLTEAEIIRHQAAKPDIRLPRAEIRKIIETPGRGITILGPNRLQLIFATIHLEGYEDLVQALRLWNTTWQVVEKGTRPIFVVWAVSLLGLGLMTVALTSDGLVCALSSVAVVAFLIWCQREIRRSPHVDAKTKKSAWVTWLVVFFMALRALFALGILHP